MKTFFTIYFTLIHFVNIKLKTSIETHAYACDKKAVYTYQAKNYKYLEACMSANDAKKFSNRKSYQTCESAVFDFRKLLSLEK